MPPEERDPESLADPRGGLSPLRIVWRRRWIALAAFTAVVVGVGLVTATMTKVYASTALLLVNPARPEASAFEQTQVSQALLATYAQLLETRSLADRVDGALAGKDGVPSAADAISVEPITDSQLLRITGEADSPHGAQLVTDSYADAFEARARELADSGALAGEVTVAEPAPLPESPVRPQPPLYLAAGVLLGLLAALGAAMLAERLDRRIELSEDATDLLGLPILTRVPKVRAQRADQLVHAEGDAGRREVDDAFRLLMTNLAFTLGRDGRHPRSIALVSPSDDEGKTLCGLGLVRAAAEFDHRPLLVEADLRAPLLGVDYGIGFSAVLLGETPLDDAVWMLPRSEAQVLSSGQLPPNPTALLSSEALREFDGVARSQFDIVVYDTPPILAGADASLVAAAADAVVVVVTPSTDRDSAAQALEQLRRTHARVVGVIVNRAPQRLRGGVQGRLRAVRPEAGRPARAR